MNYNNDLYVEKKPPKIISRRMRRLTLGMGILCLLSETFVFAAPYWRVTARWGSQFSAQSAVWMFEGIWLQCAQIGQGSGQSQCYEMYTFLNFYAVTGTEAYYDPEYEGRLYSKYFALSLLVIHEKKSKL